VWNVSLNLKVRASGWVGFWGQVPVGAHVKTGPGFITSLSTGMVKQGLSPDEAASRFYVLDHHGLITQEVRSTANAGMLLLHSDGAPQGSSCMMLWVPAVPTCCTILILGLNGIHMGGHVHVLFGSTAH